MAIVSAKKVKVLNTKRIHRLDERGMELARLLMADRETTGDVQARLKRLFADTIDQMDEHLGYEKNSVEGNNSGIVETATEKRQSAVNTVSAK